MIIIKIKRKLLEIKISCKFGKRRKNPEYIKRYGWGVLVETWKHGGDIWICLIPFFTIHIKYHKYLREIGVF